MKKIKFCIDIIKAVYFESKTYFLFTILIKVFTLLNSFILLLINKLVLNEIAKTIINDNPHLNTIIKLLLLYGVIELTSTMLFNILQYYLLKFKLQYDDNMSIRIANSLSDLDMSYYDNPKELDNTKQLNKNRNVYIESYNCIISMLFYGISFVIAFIISIKFSIWITIFTIIMILPEMIMEKNLKTKQYSLEKQLLNKQRFRDYLIGMFYNRNVEMEMQLYGYKDNIIDKIVKVQKEITGKRLYHSLQNAKTKGHLLLLNQIFSIVQQGIMVITIFNRKMSIGDYSYYGGIIRKTAQEVTSITRCINEIHIDYIKYKEFLNALSRTSKIKNNGTLKWNYTEKITIVFDHVSFKYPNEKKYILNNISFTIKQGEKLALVGVNGSGKSTILKLLLRYYEPTTGRILLNGVNIQGYEISSYRNLFSAMFQVVNIYSLSIKDNITISDVAVAANESDARCKKILKDLCLDYVKSSNINIDELYGKEFSKEGYVFSKGQQQRLAAARAIYHEANIYIMDEPDSSMDAISETKFMNTLLEYTKGKSIIYVTHRYNNLYKMDNIIVLEAGEIVESGNHSQLMSLRGRYFRMFELQNNSPMENV